MMITGIPGHWDPDIDDFKKVAGQSATAKGSELVKVKDLRTFLTGLAFGQSPKNKNRRRPKRSISRVDLISHGSVDGVAIAGEIVPAKTDGSILSCV